MAVSLFAPKQENVYHLNDLNHIQEFLLYHKLRSRRPGTLESYKAFLTRFFKEIGKTPETVITQDIRAFLLGEESKGNKPATLATKIAILRSFYTWLEREEYVVKNPMRRIDRPKLPDSLPKFLTYDELEAIREAATTLMDQLLRGQLGGVLGWERYCVAWPESLSAFSPEFSSMKGRTKVRTRTSITEINPVKQAGF